MSVAPVQAPLAGASPAPAPAAVVFTEVTKDFTGPQGSFRALDAVSLSIPTGSIYGIIGRSGAGKSTLVRLINRLEQPGAGEVRVNGVDLARLDKAALAAFRRRTGMIFQHFNLLSAKTVEDNVALPLKAARWPADRIGARVREVLALVGLEDRREAYPAKLSGGQKQRVGIARALVLGPEILLCDEATSALDPETTQSILALLRDINCRLGLTIILITHEMAVIREICHRVAVMEKGAVVEEGEVWKIFGAPAHAATQALLLPLLNSVPPELGERIVSHPADGPHETVFDLRFDGGESANPPIGQIASLLGGTSRILQAGIDRIQDRAQGRSLLSAAIDRTRLDELVAQLRGIASRAEVIGYVPSDS